MAKKKNEQFGDIVEDKKLIKRTLMVAAFPALIKQSEKDGKTVFGGFLPGFEFAAIEGAPDKDECVELLQDMLDDEIEELVVFGQPLPDIEEDDELLKKNEGYNIVYLDINVYALADECGSDCSCCGHTCGGESAHHEDDEDDCDCGCKDEKCDCEDECDDDCDCGCKDENCDCDDDCDCGCKNGKKCDCNDECDDDCDCGCHKNHGGCDDDDCGCS